MRLHVACGAAVLAVIALSACGEAPAGDAADAEASPVAAPAPAADTSALAKNSGPPAFAAVYPGGAIDESADGVSPGSSDRGGLITFTTAATPDAVVEFYKRHAEAEGLKPVMAMSQGDTRAYGAAEGGEKGASVSVVASPVEGATSVQLTWSAGG